MITADDVRHALMITIHCGLYSHRWERCEPYPALERFTCEGVMTVSVAGVVQTDTSAEAIAAALNALISPDK